MKADWRCHMLAWLLAASTVPAADAQTGPYPSRPVQILADSSAGSTPDVALRFVADRLTQAWGRQALVVNRPGAGGSLAARAAAEAAPDGYTSLPAGAVDFRVVASRGAECSLARTEGLSADRVRIGEPDVHCGLSDAGRLTRRS